MSNQKYYIPNIFDSNQSNEMTGPNNIALARSFYNARYDEMGEFSQNERATRFDRNAGAVQIYKNDATYIIPGKAKDKYNFVSFGNKEFKEYTKRDFGVKRSSYGHSERVLMIAILDDLIETDVDNHDVRRPSDISKCPYKILKALTDNPKPYKEYLERKGIIVKMWSERPACEESPEDGVGGGCLSFIEGIFPVGSQFGYIVENYTRDDNQEPIKIKKASEELKNSYLNFKQDR